MTDAIGSTLTVMEEQGIRRIVAASTQGVAEDWPRINPIMRALVSRSNIKAGFDDHNGVDALLRESSVDWTLVRAVALSNKPAKGPIRAAECGAEKPAPFVSRDAFAAFLIDSVENNTWIRQTPLVWNARN